MARNEHDLDASWDDIGEASYKLLRLSETPEWCELVDEACMCTHSTAEEIWDGMYAAIRIYLEGLEGAGE